MDVNVDGVRQPPALEADHVGPAVAVEEIGRPAGPERVSCECLGRVLRARQAPEMGHERVPRHRDAAGGVVWVEREEGRC